MAVATGEDGKLHYTNSKYYKNGPYRDWIFDDYEKPKKKVAFLEPLKKRRAKTEKEYITDEDLKIDV